MKNWILSLLALCSFLSIAQDVQLCVQTGHASTINKVIFSPNDQLLVSAGVDSKIVLWDFLTGKQYGVLLGHAESVTDIEFSADGKQLFSVSSDSTLCVWDVESEKLIRQIKFDYPLGALEPYTAGKLIVAGERIAFFDLENNTKEDWKFGAKHLFNALDVSDNHELVAVGGDKEDFMYVINLKENQLIRKFVSTVKDVEIEQDEALIFSTTDGRIVEYSLKNRKRKSTTTDWMLNSMNALELTDETVFVSDNVGNIQMLDRAHKWENQGKLKMKRGKVKDLTISNNGNYLAATGENADVVVWEIKTNKVVKSMKGRVEQINDIGFTRDGAEIIIAYNDGSVRRTNLISNQTIVNSIRPRSQIISNFSGYTVKNIRTIDYDTITFESYYRMNSLDHDGSFDLIEEYDLTWAAADNVLILDKRKKKSAHVDRYIRDLKKGVYHDEFYFVDKTLLKDTNDSLGISVEAVGEMLYVHDKITGALRHELHTGHSDLVTAVAINPVYNYVATASWDGMIRFWDLGSGELLTVYGAFGNGQFVYLDRSGYYFASKNALDYIGFKLDNKVYSFEQFDLKYNRPDIVAKSLPYFNEEYVLAYYGAYKKRLDKLGIEEDEVGITQGLPVLQVSRKVNREEDIEKLILNVHCYDQSAELDRLHVKINGVPEFGRFGKELSGKDFQEEFSIKLNPGNNYVQLYVTNKQGVSSYTQSFDIGSNQKRRAKSEMYIIALGVSKYEQSQYNLKYARKDAEDMAKFFRLEKFISFTNLHIKMLTDEDVTKENVASLKEFSQQANENDILLFFAAGHGVLDSRLDYYFASHDMDFLHPAERGIPYDLFEQIMDESKSRKKVMFLDACHSGEIDKDEVIENVIMEEEEGELIFRSGQRTVSNKYDINSFDLSRSLFADMRLNNGSTVVSSAGGAEFAIEGDEWNNGVFTFCLLKGLKERGADLNGDRVIMLSEIQKYLQNEVVKISNGLQTPTSRVENLNNDFRIM